MRPSYDLCVIGGGINGAGIARDAAGRGLSVLLLEAGDLGGATSSASTKIIHGGLRYLEQAEFKLVAESLAERERLMKSAPHLIKSLEFILPHEPHLRPAWMIRLGLFLYDRLGGRREILSASKAVNFKTHKTGAPLKEGYARGFSYSDCWADDARLVVLNVRDAADKGADIRVRTVCEGAKALPDGTGWRVALHDKISGSHEEVSARMVVNAAGPWVRRFLEDNKLVTDKTPGVRLGKGSHILVPNLYEGDHAFILQQPDGRIVFTIPFEGHTQVGTTDVNYTGDPAHPRISPEETDYLCAAVNRVFRRGISPADVVWSFSGVRPLLDSGDAKLSEVTRDYKLDLERSFGPPLLNIFGGKLTTYRHLSEQAADMVCTALGHKGKAWTQDAVLPGGALPKHDFESFFQRQEMRYPWLDVRMVKRMAHAYGTRMDEMLKDKKDMGTQYGGDLYEHEVRYLLRTEWARAADDILWRRTKLGLHVPPETTKVLEAALPALLKEETLLKNEPSYG